MDYKKLNIYTGWGTFLIATLVYLLSIEPTASFWDCGEFIASAYKLEVGHPPGAPLFMLIGRVFSMFFPIQYVATSINVISALSSSFTILFLFWTITAFAKKMVKKPISDFSFGETIAVLGSGVIGGLAYTFSDSFWFSAVEGEVYAMSSLFTAVVFWAIMKYDEVAEQTHSTRWILIIAYLMGLSIGVHLLNLLAIPAIAMVYYFRNFKVSKKGILYTFIISGVILVFVQAIIIPGTYKLAAQFELLFTNSFGLPFFSGMAVYIVLLVIAAFFGVRYTIRKNLPLWNTVIMSVIMVLIGYSTFAIILIRSNANPPMDENNPEDVFSLISYLNREQYGDRPLLYGQYWMAPLDPQNPNSDGKPVRIKAYVVTEGQRDVQSFRFEYDAKEFIKKSGKSNLKIEKKYIVSDDRKQSVQNFDPRFCSVFPRMYSRQANHIPEYKRWAKFKGKPIRVVQNGKSEILNKPTFIENLRFFNTYQVNWMYFRYFFWNFAGRQNDVQGHGNNIHGNWLSGVDFIDEQRLGNQESLPSFIAGSKSYNKYYLLPLLLGIIGLVFHFVKDVRQFSVVALLFLLTGLAIVLYLNQYPLQPRERDYAYVGSFYAFAIWIGLSVFALFDVARSIKLPDLKKIAVPAFGTGAVLYLFEAVAGRDHTLSYSIFYMSLIALMLMAVCIFLFNKVKNEKSLATIVVLLFLPVPILMGVENWDDHSRAKRRTGVDFAKNYLDSCAPNAILFTNGDNDTFPLWYAQEVEGYRTDVRVVNLSLLNTDWYIDQMKKKAYESDPVPFSMEEYMYRQGTRDIVFMDERIKQPVDLKKVINYVKDDNNRVRVNSGERLNFFPTKTFSLPVDKRKVIENGTVSIEDTALIVDAIEWKLNRNFVLKNTLMQLDLLSNFNWERPIYFAVTTGNDAYIGLQKYFQLEGLAYRLVPIKTSNNTPGLNGRIDREIMYENMVNKFQWGNMDKEDIYMDENNLRMTTNLRLQFSNLADEFIKNSENDKAKEVLDFCMKVMPEKNVPFNRIIMPIIESYQNAGDDSTAAILSARLFEIMEQDINYYISLEPEFLTPIMNELQIASAVNNRIIQTSRMTGNAELASKMEEKMKVLEPLINESLTRANRIQKVSF